jgi:hypothetical protein
MSVFDSTQPAANSPTNSAELPNQLSTVNDRIIGLKARHVIAWGESQRAEPQDKRHEQIFPSPARARQG